MGKAPLVPRLYAAWMRKGALRSSMRLRQRIRNFYQNAPTATPRSHAILSLLSLWRNLAARQRCELTGHLSSTNPLIVLSSPGISELGGGGRMNTSSETRWSEISHGLCTRLLSIAGVGGCAVGGWLADGPVQ